MTTLPDRHEIVRRAHQTAVLHAVLTDGPISRGGIGAVTQLSKPVVLAVVAELVDTGLIQRRGYASGKPGRSPVLYVANARAGVIVGIDLGGTKLRGAIADLDGIVLREEVEPTGLEGGLVVGDQIITLVRRLARRAKVPLQKISAIAIGSPGFADDDGRMQLAVNITGLSDISLVDHVRGAFRDCDVLVENDVNIAALSERAEGSGVGCDDLVVLSIGTGIGAGVIVGGRLMRGHHGAAGEVAWLTVGGEPPTRDTRARGMLEVAAAGEGIRRTLREALHTNGNSTLRATATVAEIFSAAAHGDTAAQAVVAAEAELVARAVLSVVSVVDPEKVILAGGIGANPNLLRPVMEQLDLLAPFFVKVESSKLGERSGIVGALALARGIARNRLFGEVTTADD